MAITLPRDQYYFSVIRDGLIGQARDTYTDEGTDEAEQYVPFLDAR